MAYKVMARTLRPQRFQDVVAQGHVTVTLQNAIRGDRVAQAYLFSGPRGTGKTTTARLLAMALNCEGGPTDEPCGECASCVAIRNGKSIDVLEIDGASNRGIDEIQQLREEVGFAATKGKRKLYIIDEVHMLTPEAFNALLKTLEEPPPHVIFVFATTEAQRVPETILSRCQRYNFRRIPAEQIAGQLKTALADKGEGRRAEEAALFQIARKADGAMRDALGLLDQVLSFTEGDITGEAVQELLGIIPRDLYFELTQAILDQNGADALRLVARLVEEGGDIGEFTDGLLEHLRHLLVACVEGKLIDEDLPKADREHYGAAAGAFAEDDLVRMLQAVSELALNLGRVSEPRFWLELTVMKLVKMASSVALEELMGRLEQLEGSLRERAGSRRPGSGSGRGGELDERPNPPVQTPAHLSHPARLPSEERPPPPQEERPPEPPPVEEEPPPVVPAEAVAEPVVPAEVTVETLRLGWERFVQEVKSRKISVGTFLAEGRPKSLEGQQLRIAFQRNREFHANQVRRNRAMVEGVLTELFGASFRVTCEVDYNGEADPDAEDAGSPEDDERVQMVLQIFGGEVVR